MTYGQDILDRRERKVLAKAKERTDFRDIVINLASKLFFAPWSWSQQSYFLEPILKCPALQP